MVIPVDVISPALIDSGLDVLADGGGSEFSLRRVGERIGFAGSAASHRFGNREGLIAAVGQAALEREEVEFNRFAAELPAVPCEAEPLAAVLREWLDHRARWSRRQARTICELILMGYRDAAASDFNKHYAQLSCAFLTRLCPELPPDAAQLMSLYLIAEAPNWLVMADETAFKMLSAETAGRVVAFALRQNAPTSHFWLDYSRSRPEPSLAALRHPTPTGAKQRILEAVVRTIEEEGAQAVTHRAISAKAKVSPSSLMHHFGKRSDLLRSGIQELFRHKLDAQQTVASSRAAAAPYELALYALQDPFLTPLAAAVRRKLGADSAGRPDRPMAASAGHTELVNLTKCAVALLGGARTVLKTLPEIAGYPSLDLADLKQNRRGGSSTRTR
jgi:AcrR family transcriptional regulator